MIQDSYEHLTKQRKQEAKDLSQELQGEYLNLGKKISVPQDVMIEELTLLSNRGSRMFHQRLKRVEKFILENTGRTSSNETDLSQTWSSQVSSGGEEGKKESFHTEVIEQPGKNGLVSALKGTVAKKGGPDILAPGYSGPLRDVPHEKFNVTVIPKSYHSPWLEHMSDSEKVLATINAQLPEPPQKVTPANYKCFNRTPMPFGGTAGSIRSLPLPGFQLGQTHTEPNLTWERVSRRPNFNRVPQGWVVSHRPEPTDL